MGSSLIGLGMLDPVLTLGEIFGPMYFGVKLKKRSPPTVWTQKKLNL